MNIPVTFRFYAGLNDLLPPKHRQVDFTVDMISKRSIKDAIESFMVPHVEIALLLVNEESVGWDYLIEAGDRVACYPYPGDEGILTESKVWENIPEEKRFVLDVHLGRLAGYLRLLGFDVLYESEDPGDQKLAALAVEEKRILLTCDRQLLMHRDVKWGYILRSRDSLVQVEEVIGYFGLKEFFKPYTRCKICNTLLSPVENVSLLEIPEKVLKYNGSEPDAYCQCIKCGKVYWRGSHTEKIDHLINKWSTS